MLIRHVVALVIAVLVILAAFLWVESYSSSFQSCIGEYTKHNDSDIAKQHEPSIRVVIPAYSRCTGRFVDEHNGGITAIATIFIAAFTGIIWAINQSQLRHAHRVERAYISGGGHGEFGVRSAVEQGAPTNVLVPTGQFQVHINNQGKTPGEVFRIAIEFRNADAILPAEPVYENIIHHHNWIGPGTQSRALFTVAPPANLRNPMIVYGRFYYRDIFSRTEHSSGFFQNFNRDTGESQSVIPTSRRYTDWT